jgi:mercuric ion binding protein
MKKPVLLAAAFCGFWCSVMAIAAEQSVTLAVDNMSCVTCGPIVKKSLARVAGVKQVEVSMEQHQATVTFEDTQTKTEDLVAATTNAGYPSHPVVKP